MSGGDDRKQDFKTILFLVNPKVISVWGACWPHKLEFRTCSCPNRVQEPPLSPPFPSARKGKPCFPLAQVTHTPSVSAGFSAVGYVLRVASSTRASVTVQQRVRLVHARAFVHIVDCIYCIL